jgi:hypothetical protein
MKDERRSSMLDAMYIAVIIGFFIACAVFVDVCARV